MITSEQAAEIDSLRKLNEQLVERCAAAAEVLGRIANREKLTCPTCGEIWKMVDEIPT